MSYLVVPDENVRIPRLTRGAWYRLAAGIVVVVSILLTPWALMIRMPGRGWHGPLPPLSTEEAALRDALRSDVTMLADTIGERNLDRPEALDSAAAFLERSLQGAGHAVSRQSFRVGRHTVHNLEAELVGGERRAEVVVVGAHYDSARGTPGANDNASGAAALLALARALTGAQLTRTVRLVAFVNEEPPWFMTSDMGSARYAQRCRARDEHVVAMLSLETLGCYSERENSQGYPFPMSFFYPSQGEFVAFIGNTSSRRLVREAVGSFRRHARFPSEGAALPSSTPGVEWSDHWGFGQHGYPALMVTDTALFRFAGYHTARDVAGGIDYERLARVVAGLEQVVRDLAR